MLEIGPNLLALGLSVAAGVGAAFSTYIAYKAHERIAVNSRRLDDVQTDASDLKRQVRVLQNGVKNGG